MEIFFLNAAKSVSFILVFIFVISIIKVLIYYFARSYYWGISHFFLFSYSNIKETESKFRIFIKVINNLLTLSIFFIVLTFLLSDFLLQAASDNEQQVAVVDAPVSSKNSEILEVVRANHITLTDSIETEHKNNYSAIYKDPKADKKAKNKLQVTKSKQSKVIDKRVFTIEDMYTVLNLVNAKKEREGIKSNCVQIIKTKSSNVYNTFELAKFFQKQGFIIAGREQKSIEVKGLRLDIDGIIFKVTIGSY